MENDKSFEKLSDDEVESSTCEYCGCSGHDNDNKLSEMIDLVKSYQEEIVVMFSRIMGKLSEKDDVSQMDTDNDIDDPDFSIDNFPCSDIEELKRLNTLCGTKQTVNNILVINISNHFSITLI